MMNKMIFGLVALGLLFITSPRAFAQSSGGAATKANLDLPYDAAGSSDEDEEAPEVIVFFCLDKSGSMKDSGKFGRLKQEVIKNITQFSDKVQFGIVFFDAGMSKFPASGRPADATPSLKAAGVAFVTSMQAGSGTCLKAALVTCLT